MRLGRGTAHRVRLGCGTAHSVRPEGAREGAEVEFLAFCCVFSYISPSGGIRMEYRQFGNTEIEVSVLGFGAGHVGSPEQDDAAMGRLLNQILDSGITLLDTARGYGLSEERIGRHLSGRRAEFVLSTKIGYGVEGVADWTAECISRGIDEALQRLNTDYIDIVHLHSCEMDAITDPLLEPMVRAAEAGKIRVLAYSGDNDAAEYAARCGSFGSIETSVNICDQRSITRVVEPAAGAGMGVIAKRPVANAPWRFEVEPAGHYAHEYWKRWKAMDIDPAGLPWQELALRFVLTVPGVSTCIAGTASPVHLKENIAIAAKGPLDAALYDTICTVFNEHDAGWIGQV